MVATMIAAAAAAWDAITATRMGAGATLVATVAAALNAAASAAAQ